LTRELERTLATIEWRIARVEAQLLDLSEGRDDEIDD